MTTYENLVNDLKIRLKNKNIKFKNIFQLINNQEYDKIIEIIKEDSITNLIEDINNERIRIGNSMETKLNNLIWLNERLIQFNIESQTSINKALILLKKVFINIYDLESEQYDKRTTKQLLRKELMKRRDRIFPLNYAKGNRTLRCFLIRI
jgi:hypothetical protein